MHRSFAVLAKLGRTDEFINTIVDDVPVHRIDDVIEQVNQLNRAHGWAKFSTLWHNAAVPLPERFHIHANIDS